jgi:DNA polymerase
MDDLIAAIKTRDLETIHQVHVDPLRAVADAQRGYLIAAPGKELIVSDFSAIQAVATAWLAGEQWKLDAFASIQRGEKYMGADDIYCATAAGILGRLVTKKGDPEGRQVGKIAELAFGFEGGVNAWLGFDNSGHYAESEINDFKLGWRKKHPMTKRLWRELKTACAMAILHPGQRWTYRHISFETVVDAAGPWLTMILPSGRRIWYFNPHVECEDTRWGPDYVITCEGRDNKRGGRWSTVYLYGGLLTENAAMGIERDLLTPALFKLEAAGYPVVLTVYDEAVAEVPLGFGSQDEFDSIMRDPPEWAAGMPIATAGWRGTRYKKA